MGGTAGAELGEVEEEDVDRDLEVEEGVPASKSTDSRANAKAIGASCRHERARMASAPVQLLHTRAGVSAHCRSQGRMQANQTHLNQPTRWRCVVRTRFLGALQAENGSERRPGPPDPKPLGGAARRSLGCRRHSARSLGRNVGSAGEHDTAVASLAVLPSLPTFSIPPPPPCLPLTPLRHLRPRRAELVDSSVSPPVRSPALRCPSSPTQPQL